jgi:hypothetical protein
MQAAVIGPVRAAVVVVEPVNGLLQREARPHTAASGSEYTRCSAPAAGSKSGANSGRFSPRSRVSRAEKESLPTRS